MHNEGGFNLTEFMVVVAIIAILSAVAVPNIRQMQANYKVTSAATTLLTSLREARSEALTKRVGVKVASISSTNWALQGWQMTIGTSTTPALIESGLPSSIVAPASATEVTFDGITGRPSATMTFKVCDKSYEGERGVDITIQSSGVFVYKRHTDAIACTGVSG